MTRLIAAFTLLAFLVACGGIRDSRLNPLNWFGRDKEERVLASEDAGSQDPRGLVEEIIMLKVDRMPGGAIVHAIGLPPTQGNWAAELIPLNGEKPDKGTLVYEFRLMPPPHAKPAGTQRSREIVVGHFVSDQTMLGVRKIEVIALRNRRKVSR